MEGSDSPQNALPATVHPSPPSRATHPCGGRFSPPLPYGFMPPPGLCPCCIPTLEERAGTLASSSGGDRASCGCRRPLPQASILCFPGARTWAGAEVSASGLGPVAVTEHHRLVGLNNNIHFLPLLEAGRPCTFGF